MGELEEKQNIGTRLRAAREQAGLSQGQVARLMNLHRPSISEAEAGRRKVSADELIRFAEIYGVSTGWLAGEATQINTDPRVELAARELARLKPEDLEKLLELLSSLRSNEEAS